MTTGARVRCTRAVAAQGAGGPRRTPLVASCQALVAKVLPALLIEGDGEREVNLAWAVPTKYPGTKYPGVSGAVG